MFDTRDFLQRVVQELRNDRSLSEETCEAFAKLPPKIRVAYGRAMRFLGCESVDSTTIGEVSVCEADRIQSSKLILLGLYVDSNTPRWSSWMLDRLLEAVMGTPGASASDLLHALHELLEEHAVELTEPVSYLIKQLVIKCFMEHRASYEAADWTWMVRKTIEGATPAQAYLALLAISPDIMQSRCAIAILQELEDTPYRNEAMSSLEEDLQDPESRSLVEPPGRRVDTPLDIEAPLTSVRDHG